MINPLVSIIVPVYNVKNYLCRCVDSILNQTFSDWECILVDDGSTDGSGNICDKYAETDKRFRVVHQKNQGVSIARNVGLRICRGKYIWFIDSDDWVDFQSLEYFYDKLAINDVDILFFGLVEKPSNTKNEELKSISSECCEGKKECAHKILLLEQAGLFGWTVNKVFKKSIVERSNLLFDSRFSIQEDHLFTLEYMKYVNKMQVLHVYPYYYEQRESSLINKTSPYDSTSTRNLTMYQKRRELTEVFDFHQNIYEKWFTTDYIVREIRNLRKMKKEGFSFSRRIVEINRVRTLISEKNFLSNSRIEMFRVASWLPSFVLSIFL